MGRPISGNGAGLSAGRSHRLARQRELEARAAERRRCRCASRRRRAPRCRAPSRGRGRVPASPRRRARRAAAPCARSASAMPGPSSSMTRRKRARASRAPASTVAAMRTRDFAPLAGVVEQVAEQLGEVGAIADELRLRRDRGLEQQVLVAVDLEQRARAAPPRSARHPPAPGLTTRRRSPRRASSGAR